MPLFPIFYPFMQMIPSFLPSTPPMNFPAPLSPHAQCTCYNIYAYHGAILSLVTIINLWIFICIYPLDCILVAIILSQLSLYISSSRSNPPQPFALDPFIHTFRVLQIRIQSFAPSPVNPSWSLAHMRLTARPPILALFLILIFVSTSRLWHVT